MDGSQGPESQLPSELALLLDAMRQEFDSKLSSLKAWGLAMCLAGGTVGGVVAQLVAPDKTQSALHAATHLLPL